MLITELGAAETILLGVALGFGNLVILNFWIQCFSKYFVFTESKWFWPIFIINMLVWIVGICVVPYDLINNNMDIVGPLFLIYFPGSLIIRFIISMFK